MVLRQKWTGLCDGGTHVNNIRAHGVMLNYVGRCVSVGAQSQCVTLSCVTCSVCFGVQSPGDMTGSRS